jgi:ribosomal protein RSM22 (predicted rRNA methylase)
MSAADEFESGLRAALARAVAGLPERELTTVTEALVTRYRAVAAATDPILESRVHVAAYAAYRMPATTAAMRRVLGVVAGAGFAPETLLDLGGGTGAAAWAAAETFPSLRSLTVLDQVDAALALGRALVAEAPSGPLRATRFERAFVDDLPEVAADLVTVSYVLSELTAQQRSRLVAASMARGRVVAIAEPGTPNGYLRILAVRRQFLGAGWTLLGPCPHALDCPLTQGDWCHFAARVSRSAEHRRLKGAQLSYEDEKFSWVAAAAPGVAEPRPSAGRVLRHPLKRKGFVEFQVCRPDGTAGREVISKKAGERYRAARDADWGDELPA